MKQIFKNAFMLSLLAIMVVTFAFQQKLYSCTGITLKAKDGSYIQARTQEWGAFNLKSKIMMTPRGLQLQSIMPDNKPGLKWESKYGVVGINGLHKPIYIDGVNEKGLSISVLYLPDYTEFQDYNPKLAQKSLNPADLSMWLLTNFAKVNEIRNELPNVRVVPVALKELGEIPPPIHFLVSDIKGNTIVIEYLKGQLNIFDNPVGVLTNSPEFPWHLTNLSNYVGLQAKSWKPIKVGDLKVKPLGVGNGMLGLPGDYSPPSRFVRAVALRNTVCPLTNGEDAVLEAFRILNNFDIPLGAVAAPAKDIMGSTQWTTAIDTKALCYYYHTQYNSRLRKIKLKDIDFSKEKITYTPMDSKKKQDYKMVTIK